jgi:hypothetical protein
MACDRDFEKNVPYDDIQNVICGECGYSANRVYKFSGLVWSPTRNNGYS